MILFKNIKYKNFLSTGNVFTEIKLNEHATTLIIGENGAGKSTFLDAITFALFGKPFRNINKSQLINSINGKECVVEVNFSIANKKYKVVRGIKPNVFEIYCDGELVNQDARAKDYQDQLEKLILKMNYKSFTQIVILGSTNFTPFMQLSASDRRVVIEDLLDIQVFSAMNAIVKTKLSKYKEEANALKVQIDSVKGKIELHKKHLDELKRNNQEIIDSKKKELNDNKQELSVLASHYAEIESQINELSVAITDEETSQKKYSKLNVLEGKIENNILKIKNDIDFYSNNSTCPTCDQTINNKDEKVHTCNDKINELTSGLDKLRTESNNLLLRINEIRTTQNTINALQKKLVETTTNSNKVNKYIAKLESEITALQTKPTMSDEFKSQSKELLNELQRHNDARKDAVTNQQNFDIVSQLLKDGGIKSKIIKQYIPVINKLVNKYLTAMDFFVNFTMDEEFKETIKSRHRDDFCYDNFSEGEKARLNLAILFAWRSVAKLKNSVSTNLLILDEVFDGSLDASGTESLLNILSSLDSDTNLFVISHKTEQMLDKFKNTIKFSKSKNFSSIC
jgi:DNA repair exonuclease SbcCD ATPase subunit